LSKKVFCSSSMKAAAPGCASTAASLSVSGFVICAIAG